MPSFTRIDFLQMAAPERVAADLKTITDPVSGQSMTIWMRPLSIDEQYILSERTAEIVTKVNGAPELGIEPTGQAKTVPRFGHVKLSNLLVSQVAQIEAMQGDPELTERYSFDDLLACAVKCPGLWSAINNEASKVQRSAHAMSPKADAASTDTPAS